MSSDESRPPPSRRARPVEKKVLSVGPARDLRDVVYRLYAEADRPQLAELALQIAGDDDLPGSPGKDLIGKIISGDGLAGQQDTVTVAATLARAAGRRDVTLIAEQVRQQWIAAATAESAATADDRLGRPVADCDPLVLEVHPAIQASGGGVTDVLPGYVPRAHDARLRELVDGMLADGRSRLVTLVGGSSTGKTRAGWELARYLEEQRPGRWWLWHPFDPTRPQAALVDLAKAGPYTIVWLNEAQHYLMPADPGLGERIAAGLRTLLTDPGRGPVLVLATLWPNFWTALTTRPTPENPDVFGQARDLLTLGTEVILGATFTPAELAGLAGPGIDARLRYAAEHAEGGRITQYLAGAPIIERRYRTAVNTMPAARAILQVAIDARRLGHPLALPHALFEQAAPGYLDDHDWDALGDDWLEAALAYTAQRCEGARGPLTRIRSRPGEPAMVDGQPCYRLADYLEQLGRTERAGVYPPDRLWTAFGTTITDPDVLRRIGYEAEKRGRYQHAIDLYRQAAARGDSAALVALVELRDRAGDHAGADALATQAAARGDSAALVALVEQRDRAGDHAGADALATQAAARGDSAALVALVEQRDRAGHRARIALATHHATSGDSIEAAADDGGTSALAFLSLAREREGDHAGAEALAVQAADNGSTAALWNLVWGREWTGDHTGAEALAIQAADYGDTTALVELARLRERTGEWAGAEMLYRRAAGHSDGEALPNVTRLRENTGRSNTDALGDLAVMRLDSRNRCDTWVLGDLATLREWASDHPTAEALAAQAADHDSIKLVILTVMREQTGDHISAEDLAVQAARYGDTRPLVTLAEIREAARDQASAEKLYRWVADHGTPDALWHIAALWERAGEPADADRLRRCGLTGAGEVATVLHFGADVGPTPG
jgi:hypothetical protein